jgi:hypothetical protein
VRVFPCALDFHVSCSSYDSRNPFHQHLRTLVSDAISGRRGRDVDDALLQPHGSLVCVVCVCARALSVLRVLSVLRALYVCVLWGVSR